MGKERLRKRELVRQCVPSPVRVKEKEQGKRALPGTQLEDRNDRRTMLKDITTQLCAAKRERRRGQQILSPLLKSQQSLLSEVHPILRTISHLSKGEPS